MNIYLFPTEAEAEVFYRLSPDSKVVISGVGMAATAATVLRLMGEGVVHSDDRIILAGVAGTYGDIALCEVVEVVEERCSELPERFQRSYRVAPSTTLRAVVANTVHGANAPIWGASIESMEGAALFAMAEVANIGVTEIRAISNRVGEPFERWRFREAVEALAKALVDLKFVDYE